MTVNRTHTAPHGQHGAGQGGGQAAAQAAGSSTPLGAVATAAFQMLIENGHGDLDSSSVIKVIDPKME